MQKEEGAFESWAIVIKFYLKDIIDTITIDWENISENNNLHFNRFVYRLKKFIDTYNEWVLCSKSIPPIYSNLVCNYPDKSEAANKNEFKEGDEGWLEDEYLANNKDSYDSMNRQLPTGIFKDIKSDKTHYTPGQNSCIDLWAIKDNIIYIFELKKPDNKRLGIISEIMFYTNLIYDIITNKIKYNVDKKMQDAINENHRGFGDFFKAISTGKIQRIESIMLAEKLHGLITPELIKFINNSTRLKTCGINYSHETLNL